MSAPPSRYRTLAARLRPDPYETLRRHRHIRLPASTRSLGLVLTLGLIAAPAAAQTTDYEAEIAALTAHPGVQRALQSIEDQDAATMRDLRELTQIPAPPFMETARAMLILLAQAGIPGVS